MFREEVGIKWRGPKLALKPWLGREGDERKRAVAITAKARRQKQVGKAQPAVRKALGLEDSHRKVWRERVKGRPGPTERALCVWWTEQIQTQFKNGLGTYRQRKSLKKQGNPRRDNTSRNFLPNNSQKGQTPIPTHLLYQKIMVNCMLLKALAQSDGKQTSQY
jgi:hypothetical protein